MGLIGGGHDDVLPRTQSKTLGHLPQVDVSLAASLGGVEQEELFLHVLLISMHLAEGMDTVERKKRV